MNYLDIIICILLVWGVVKGFRKGLVIAATSLFALILGIYGGIKFSDYVAALLLEHTEIQESYIPICSFILVFLFIVLAVNILGHLLEQLVKLGALGLINKVLGSVFGLIKSTIIIGILVLILNYFDKRIGLLSEEVKQKSFFYQKITEVSTTLIPALKESSFFKDFFPKVEEEKETII